MTKAYMDITICGKRIYNTVGVSSGDHTGKRATRKRITPEAARKYNDRLAARNLAMLIDNNFGPGDGWHTLTYAEPPTRAEAEKELNNFLRRMKYRMGKAGTELKYIAVTEYENHRIHHHVLMNTDDSALVQKVWGKGYARTTPVQDEETHRRLAEYMIKETQKTFRDPDSERKQRCKKSRNLVKPVTKRVEVSLKHLFQEPEPIDGYYIVKESLRKYENPVTGLQHMEYIQAPLREPRRFRRWPAGKIVREKPIPVPYEKQRSIFEMFEERM